MSDAERRDVLVRYTPNQRSNHWLIALMVTAGSVGALHSLAPDHWVPFAALARARSWTPLLSSPRMPFIMIKPRLASKRALTFCWKSLW